MKGEDARSPAVPGWLTVERDWRAGDCLEVRLPMRLALNPAPDDSAVQALTYGPVVLAGGYGARAPGSMPRLDTASVTLTSARPLAFQARADSQPVMLVPIARTRHQHYTVYWRT